MIQAFEWNTLIGGHPFWLQETMLSIFNDFRDAMEMQLCPVKHILLRQS